MKPPNIKLKYGIYDFDDNILHMDTKIVMEKYVNNEWIETQVSTTDFTTKRKDPLYRVPLNDDGSTNYDKAYSNFRDIQSNDNTFLNDVIDAIANKQFAPSYHSFKKCLIEGRICYILTARGHHPSTIKRGIEYIIDTQFSKKEKILMKENLLKYYNIFNKEISNTNDILENYFSLCEFIGVSSPHFKELVEKNNLCPDTVFDPSNTEVSKKIAVKYIVEKLHQYKITDYHILKIGFSDDDKHNLKSIEDLFKTDLGSIYTGTDFTVFDTSKNEDGSKNYKKIKI